MALQADGTVSGNRSYETPWSVVAKLGEVFSQRSDLTEEWYFDLDPCATDRRIAKAPAYYRPRQDGLRQSWFWRVWLNPPYGPAEPACKPGCAKKRCERRGYHLDSPLPGIGDWVRKAADEWAQGNCELVVALLPGNACEQAWFQDTVLKTCELISFLPKRLHFELGGVPQKQPGINNLVAVWRDKRSRAACPVISLDLDTIQPRLGLQLGWPPSSIVRVREPIAEASRVHSFSGRAFGLKP